MNSKAYHFAGCTIRLESDTPVLDSALFTEFRCDKAAKADLNIKIIHSPLPEIDGTPVFSDGRCSYYIKGGKSFYYTSYPSGTGVTELSCRVIENNIITLYVVPGHPLWDSLVAYALNYTQLLFHRGIATLHSSCIEVNGKAILFVGKKEVGKSTQAMLWNQHRGAKIINGDRIAVKSSEDGMIAYGIPFCGSSKIALNKTLAVKAVVILGKAEMNTLCRLNVFEAFKSVIGNLTYNTEDIVQLNVAVDIAQQIAENVPVFSLMCVPDESSVKILEEQLCQI